MTRNHNRSRKKESDCKSSLLEIDINKFIYIHEYTRNGLYFIWFLQPNPLKLPLQISYDQDYIHYLQILEPFITINFRICYFILPIIKHL